MTQPGYAIGIDFGTASARTLLLDISAGEEVAVCELAYRHGVIDEILPSTGERLPTDWALQDPDDYVDVLRRGIVAVLTDKPDAAGHVVGIGIDATSCTVIPATAQGDPLCRLPRWRSRPHAWPKLWKHHAAQAVATRLNEVALERNETFLGRYGGRISSEWYFPKLIQIWLEDPEVYQATERFIELADWVVWYLCGSERRSTCPASYKALWSPDDGLPSAEFFGAAYPGFAHWGDRLGQTFLPLGTCAGTLRAALAEDLGLGPDVAVAVGNVDSFVSFPGAGAEGRGTFVSVVGTSICDMVVDTRQIPLGGITGVARDGIVPGLFGYEAGQAAVGDMFGWFASRVVGADLGGERPPGSEAPGAEVPGAEAGRRDLVLPKLEKAAAGLAPGQCGLLALDWWNGNRSVLGDADLSGVLVGLTLQTSAVEIYRALVEAVAFGNKAIVDGFTGGGIEVNEIIACGGIAEKSPLVMQLFADVSGRPVTVPASSQVPARGAALFGAVAAGPERSGFADISGAAHALAPGAARTYRPDARSAAVYAELYKIWRQLHDTLGRDQVGWLHELKRVKLAAGARRSVNAPT